MANLAADEAQRLAHIEGLLPGIQEQLRSIDSKVEKIAERSRFNLGTFASTVAAASGVCWLIANAYMAPLKAADSAHEVRLLAAENMAAEERAKVREIDNYIAVLRSREARSPGSQFTGSP